MASNQPWMHRLIPVLNEIRDTLASAKLDFGVELPQIAVVGGQSVGKSSLLEGLVGHAFLPTGSGVVTRRPLLLRLIHRSEDTQEWGEFTHAPGRRFTYPQIRDEIERETEKLCGQRKGISHEPIVLQITSPHVTDLTLIDLPGVTRLPVGDQPEDIEAQIRELILEHIRKPRCLILAVVAGNADLATADALALAREVDAEGLRTIGVVTKLDLVDQATCDLAAVLEGRVYALRRGFVGVVCRSFQDVQGGKELQDHLQAEEDFFRNHSTLKDLAPHCGIGRLARRLGRTLMDEIIEALPEIRGQALQKARELGSELAGYGEPLEQLSAGEQGGLLLSLFSKFSGRFGDAIEGKVSHQAAELAGRWDQLVGRARIDFIFHDVFTKTLNDFCCFSGLSDDEIRVTMRNASGPRATLFISEVAFELLARRQIAKLEAPSLQCAKYVFDELHRVLALSELPEFKRFSLLKERIFGVVRNILQRCLAPTNRMIKDLIEIELAYINTSHPDFIGCSVTLRPDLACGQSAGGATPNAAPNRSRRAVNGRSGPAESDSFEEEPHPSSSSTAGVQPLQPKEEDVDGAGSSGGFLSALGFGRQRTGTGGSRGGTASREGLSPSAAPQRLPHGNSGRPPEPPGGRHGQRPSIGVLVTVMPPFHLCLEHHSGAAAHVQSSVSSTSTAAGPRLAHLPPAIWPAASPPTERERVEVQIVKVLLENYLKLVKKNVADSVPKAIMLFLVGGAGITGVDPARVSSLKDVIQGECVASLYKEELFQSLLAEAPDVQSQRTRCLQHLAALRRVNEVLESLSARSCGGSFDIYDSI